MIYLMLVFLLLHNVVDGNAAKSQAKSKTEYFCDTKFTCNFGRKQTCLIKNGIYSPSTCVDGNTDCISHWKKECTQKTLPKCLDRTTECICICVQGQNEEGIFEKLKNKIG
uniref:Uncharacterized protein n=1 Tax=Rhipicephalus zambeziensis TaxID=60191 RepID=A0A224Y5J6_9ACAR